jgi:hypothetical protein
MPRLTIDLSEAQSRKPIPEGTYEAKVAEITGPHKGPKAPYLTFVFEVENANNEVANGRKFYHNTPIKGQGAGIFADTLSKLTGQEVDVDDLETLDIDTDELLGLPVGLVIKDDEYPKDSGEISSAISKILKAK